MKHELDYVQKINLFWGIWLEFILVKGLLQETCLRFQPQGWFRSASCRNNHKHSMEKEKKAEVKGYCLKSLSQDKQLKNKPLTLSLMTEHSSHVSCYY